MTAGTPRHSPWASRYLGRPIRRQLIDAGVLVPSEQTSILTPLPRRPRGPVLRIDQAGREEAQRARHARRLLQVPTTMSEVLARPALYGARPPR